jgi:hypothetical protein
MRGYDQLGMVAVSETQTIAEGYPEVVAAAAAAAAAACKKKG